MNKVNGVSTDSRQNREILESKRAELLASLRTDLPAVSRANGVTEEDVSPVLQEQSVEVQLKRIYYLQLKLVDAALARLESKSGGLCEECGTPIPAKRLEAIPWVARCISCQESVGVRHS